MKINAAHAYSTVGTLYPLLLSLLLASQQTDSPGASSNTKVTRPKWLEKLPETPPANLDEECCRAVALALSDGGAACVRLTVVVCPRILPRARRIIGACHCVSVARHRSGGRLRLHGHAGRRWGGVEVRGMGPAHGVWQDAHAARVVLRRCQRVRAGDPQPPPPKPAHCALCARGPPAAALVVTDLASQHHVGVRV